jgi:hypothetical protein
MGMDRASDRCRQLVRLLLPVLLLSALSSFSADAAAQQQPTTDDERLAMYCVEVLRAEIDLQHHMIAASLDAAGRPEASEARAQWINTSAELLQGLAKLEAALYRFQVFMLPRIPTLDPASLVSAIRQGEADFEQSRAVASSACGASCSDSALLRRLAACEDPSWLPL